MKSIKKTKKKLPVVLLVVLVFVFALAVSSLLLSIKYFGEANKTFPDLVLTEKLEAPECTSKGGFYTQPIEIKLTQPNTNCKIYYTLDGTEPTLSSAIYVKPIVITDRTNEESKLSTIPTSPRWTPPLGNVFKGTVLRAIVVSETNTKSEELIRTFFVNEKGRSKYTFPVIELTVNPDDLFGYKNGIYVLGKNYDDKNDYLKKDVNLDLPWWKYPSNYLKRGNNASRFANIEYFDTQGGLAFEKLASIRINGNATRGFAQKSLRISFVEEPLHYKLFKESNVELVNSFILRNSGNDWDKTMFRDAFMQSLMKDINIDRQNNSPAIVFINAEYWGIHNICERYDENYLANKYHLSTDSLIILEMSGTVSYGKKHDANDFKSLLEFIQKNDLGIISNYKKIESEMDIVNFTDILISNIYFCNSDWPNNNVKFWKYKGDNTIPDSMNVRDGRWRWMLYDTDWGFGYTSTDGYNVNLLEKAKNTGSVGIIFSGLLKNKTYVELFKNRFEYHLNNTFKAEKVLKRISEFENSYSPEIAEHINRWRVIGSTAKWNKFVDELKTFATKRPPIQEEQLNKFLKENAVSHSLAQ